ncbi:MAG TPA: GNAT family N-acetyltransferase [Solirubrobacteraceae bacterium]
MPPRAAWPSPAPIETERLVLEPLRADHAREMVRVLQDPELYAITGGEPPRLEELRARYRRQATGRSPDGQAGWLNWVLHHRSEGVLIGTVQATLTSQHGRTSAAIAWTVGVGHQRRGYATEASTGMAQWLARHGVVSLVAHIHPRHDASIGVARRLGLVATGVVVNGETRWASPHPAPVR